MDWNLMTPGNEPAGGRKIGREFWVALAVMALIICGLLGFLAAPNLIGEVVCLIILIIGLLGAAWLVIFSQPP